MFAAYTSVILATLGLGILTFVFFLWAFFSGHFDDLDAQAVVILDEHDLRLEREWESEREKAERVRAYGAPVVPEPGEFGGRF